MVRLYFFSLFGVITFGALQCNVRVEKGDITAKFNLAPYVLSEFSVYDEGYYCIKDALANDPTKDRNYSYCFNLCSPVLDYPIYDDWQTNVSYCAPGIIKDNGYCPKGVSAYDCQYNETKRVPITGKAWAYQIRNDARISVDERDCWRLSDERGGSPPEWSFYDINDPSAGVVIDYLNGEFSNGCGKNRELKLIFKCSNDRYTIPRTEVVTELNNNCTYVIEIESIYGCPVQCSQSNSICNGNGLCGYDFGINEAKCFCFQEYTGESCSDFSTIQFTPSQKEKPDSNNELVLEFEPLFDVRQENGDIIEYKVEVIYDYRIFGLDGDHYLVKDLNSYGKWVYYISVGTPIDTQYLPESCEFTNAPCFDYNVDTEKCDYVPPLYNDTAYVYRYSNRTGECNLLGRIPSYQLINTDDDFAKGVKLTYTGGAYGDKCETPSKNRVFDINFVCPNSDSSYNWNKTYDTDTHEIAFTTLVKENSACEYEITIENALACPYQCITSDPNFPDDDTKFAVCSGRGRCAADPFAGFVRCICDTGYSGDECETELTNIPTSSPTDNPTRPCSDSETVIVEEKKASNIGLIVVVVILALIIVIGGGLGYYKYNKDISMYKKEAQLVGDGDGDGATTELNKIKQISSVDPDE